MADDAGSALQSTPKAAMQKDQSAADVEVIEGRADTPDSDDYDPSATMPQDFSLPTTTAQEVPDSIPPIPVLPEDASSPRALLSPLEHHPSSTPATQSSTSKMQFPTSQDSAHPQSQPRLKGGFVVDDEDEDIEADVVKDGDVYDSADGMDASNTTPAAVPVPDSQNLVDRVSIPGALPASEMESDVTNGAHNVDSLAAAVQNGDAFPRDSTVTLVQSFPNLPVKVVQPPSAAGTPAPAVPKARLAHDILGILEDRIKEDPRGDMDAWLSLLAELRSRNKKDEVRRIYSNFFKQFPLAVCYWTSTAVWPGANRK
jgi:cleavage stimulation factor subunit 3